MAVSQSICHKRGGRNSSLHDDHDPEYHGKRTCFVIQETDQSIGQRCRVGSDKGKDRINSTVVPLTEHVAREHGDADRRIGRGKVIYKCRCQNDSRKKKKK